MFSKNGEELEILIYAFVHAFHVPKIQREILRLRMPGSYLSLKKDERTRLRENVAPELGE